MSDQTDKPDDAEERNKLEADNLHFVYFERSLQIIVGATITVTAGFLSQIWGSASIKLKSALADDLITLGQIFVLLMAMSTLRYGLFVLKINTSKRSEHYIITSWIIGAVIAFNGYIYTISRMGEIIRQFASMAN